MAYCVKHALFAAFLMVLCAKALSSELVVDEPDVPYPQTRMKSIQDHRFQGKGVGPHENITFLGGDGQRGMKYITMAKRFMKTVKAIVRKQEQGDDEEDSFMYLWLAAQQIFGAVEIGGHDPQVMKEAVEQTMELLELPDMGQNIINTPTALEWAGRACSMDRSFTKKILPRLRRLAQHPELEDDARTQVQLQVSMLQKPDPKLSLGKPGNVATQLVAVKSRFRRPGFVRNVVPYPPESQLPCTASGKCGMSLDHLAEENRESLRKTIRDGMSTYQLFANRVSTLSTKLPKTFHKRISDIAIRRYEAFTKEMRAQGNTAPEDINNQFFSDQAKTWQETQSPRSIKFWPELYRDSKEFRLIRKLAKSACIEHAMRFGRPQRREDLEKMNLVLWAAVYTTRTTHSTHVHEQSACSGVYYSQNPPGEKTPFIMSDPRGAHSMWIDSTKPEREPEAPFYHQYMFYPNTGDMVLFPSYVPHRVPVHASKVPRVAWAFNLEGDVDTWARMNI